MNRMRAFIRIVVVLSVAPFLIGVAHGQATGAFNAAAHDAAAAAREAHLASEARMASEARAAEHTPHVSSDAHASSVHVPNNETRWVDGYGTVSNTPKPRSEITAPHSEAPATVEPPSKSSIREVKPAQPKTETVKAAAETRPEPLTKTSNSSRDTWKEQNSEVRAQKRVDSYSGHGNSRHGSQTTPEQQQVRIATDVAPDGKIAPTQRATRFDSAKAQAEAVEKAKSQLRTNNPTTLTKNGKPAQHTEVVTGRRGGYGSGYEKTPTGEAHPTGQDTAATVHFRFNEKTGKFEPVTQFPSKGK